MAKTASPLHAKRVSKSVSQPATTAEDAATVAEAAVALPARRAAKKTGPAPVAAKNGVAKPAKAHKPKLVRDSFTMPKDEYQILEALKGRALGLEKHVRKSELLRAGVQALSAMNDRAFLKAIGAVPTLKTGRPKSA
jgi:hypothetical protein